MGWDEIAILMVIGTIASVVLIIVAGNEIRGIIRTWKDDQGD